MGLETATIVAIAALSTSLVGTGISAYSAMSSGNAAEEAANRDAETKRQAALDAINRANTQADVQRQKARKVAGQQMAAFGASGFDPVTGNPMDILQETAGMGELDALRIVNNAQRQAWGLQEDANLTQWRGGMARKAANQNAVGTVIGGLGKAGATAYSFFGSGTNPADDFQYSKVTGVK